MAVAFHMELQSRCVYKSVHTTHGNNRISLYTYTHIHNVSVNNIISKRWQNSEHKNGDQSPRIFTGSVRNQCNFFQCCAKCAHILRRGYMLGGVWKWRRVRVRICEYMLFMLRSDRRHPGIMRPSCRGAPNKCWKCVIGMLVCVCALNVSLNLGDCCKCLYAGSIMLKRCLVAKIVR